MPQMMTDKKLFTTLKKIKMNYAEQQLPLSEVTKDTWPLLKSSLYFDKVKERYIMYISTHDNWRGGQVEADWIACSTTEINAFFGREVTAVTPLILVEDVAVKIKPFLDSRVMDNELVGIKLQSRKSILILSSSDLLILLRYLEHSPKIIRN
ncbi:hypothetical protein [Liquorilactobacillus capillatus]|nr:hypothetical protein [Liquorilactobacillus capillatus]